MEAVFNPPSMKKDEQSGHFSQTDKFQNSMAHAQPCAVEEIALRQNDGFLRNPDAAGQPLIAIGDEYGLETFSL